MTCMQGSKGEEMDLYRSARQRIGDVIKGRDGNLPRWAGNAIGSWREHFVKRAESRRFDSRGAGSSEDK